MFARSLDDGCWRPLVAFVLAAASDYADGPIARRAGPATRYGALVDSVADIFFVLVATTAGAITERLSWAVPFAIVGAAVPYLVASLRRSRANDPTPRAYSPVGHAAGVCNYALVGLLAGSLVVPGVRWPPLLGSASAVVVALNLTALGLRLRRSAGDRAQP